MKEKDWKKRFFKDMEIDINDIMNATITPFSTVKRREEIIMPLDKIKELEKDEEAIISLPLSEYIDTIEENAYLKGKLEVYEKYIELED